MHISSHPPKSPTKFQSAVHGRPPHFIVYPTAPPPPISTHLLLICFLPPSPPLHRVILNSHNTHMSSLAAAGISHSPRHVVDCRSPLSTTSVLSPRAPSLPFPRTFFTSQLNYSPRYYNSGKPLPSRPFLYRPASRRSSDFNPKVDDSVDSRNWSRSIGRSEFADDDEVDDYDDDDEEEEEDRSLDLFLKFVQNIYKKISKRARKAVRSVLPAIIPSKLVGFSVDGVIVLAFLWVLKAFLEVVCTLGSVVFVSILLTRVVWTGVAYLQESRILRMNGEDDDDDGDRRAWTGARPAT